MIDVTFTRSPPTCLAMSPQTLVLATTLIGAAATVLEVTPDGVVDDVPVDDGVELHAANTRVVAARAPAAAAIRGRKRVVMRGPPTNLMKMGIVSD